MHNEIFSENTTVIYDHCSISDFLPCSPVFAITLSNSETVVDSCEVVLEEHNGYVLSIRGKDLSNGDARFSLIENGQLISCSYVDRSAEMIIYTNYQNGVEISREEKVIEKRMQPDSAYAQMGGDASVDAVVPPDIPPGGGYVYVGKVGYNHYVQGMNTGINYIEWSYSTNTNPTSVCDLNGQYRDIVDFSATILGLLGLLTSSGSLEIVTTVLSVLGIAGSVGEFLVPEYIVSCTRTEVVWRAFTKNQEKRYQGFRCVVTHPDKSGQVVYEGNYYPTTAIANHNFSLALDPYMNFYPGSDYYEIASWPS